ncbi:glycosyltransferase [Flammeovirga kamogawensis]|uniref:Glycosyltransferase n=1 Tax=Flammeovirga kamogawensis TaxID=373891 RepID=A0ABX8GYZ8_9BACT|nr:glycosyltransferase [Flammeovirga kamogawensis]MBB6458983.1 glycosyltransferase involved in cell wall biosynthesis [Flammeovirga kamogawensis]QWG08558.1 glycosyltransferase [Flammeovirga kamogawensis]
MIRLSKGWNLSFDYDNTPRSLQENTTVCVIIALRNEADNVEKLLESLSNQSYKNLEFIFINDHSDDTTYQLLKGNTLNKSTVLNLPNYLQGKKQAIRFGIEHTKAQLIVTTDADCTQPKNWVKSIVNCYQETGALMVSGPVHFTYKSFFERLMSVEFSSLIITGAASIRNQTPNMCNAANLAFERTAFLQQNNYKEHAHIPTGDDEFFLHQLAKEDPSKIVFLKNHDAIVSTTPPKSIISFINQRVRWASKWKHYKNKGPQYTAVFIFIFHLTFYFSGIHTLFFNGHINIFVVALCLRWVCELFYMKSALKWFNDLSLLYTVPFLSLFYPFYAIFIGLLATFTKYSWKNRIFSV